MLEKPPSDAYEGREDTEEKDEEDFLSAAVEASELTVEVVIIEGSEEDVEVVSSELIEDVGGEVSIHMIPGNLSRRYPNHKAIWYGADLDTFIRCCLSIFLFFLIVSPSRGNEVFARTTILGYLRGEGRY